MPIYVIFRNNQNVPSSVNGPTINFYGKIAQKYGTFNVFLMNEAKCIAPELRIPSFAESGMVQIDLIIMGI